MNNNYNEYISFNNFLMDINGHLIEQGTIVIDKEKIKYKVKYKNKNWFIENLKNKKFDYNITQSIINENRIRIC